MCTEQTTRAANTHLIFWNIMKCITTLPRLKSPLSIIIQPTMVRHSKLQKQVLSLYRQFLRAAQDKPGFIPRIRDEFRANAAIKKTEVMHIEYLYRRGQRQLELLKDVNTKQLGSFSKSKDNSWPFTYQPIRVFKYQYWNLCFLGNYLMQYMYNALAQLFKWKDQMIFTFLRLDKIKP